MSIFDSSAIINTIDGTASSGSDYTSIIGTTVTIAAGQTSTTISIPIIDDSNYEGDENLQISLSSPSRASLGVTAASISIVDDDLMPIISISNYSVNENAGFAAITISQDKLSVLPSSFTWSTANGTALAASDYSAAISVPATIPAGQLSTTISLPITDDSIYETNETLTISIGNAANATIGNSTGTITIVEDELAPSLSINSVTVNELAGTIAVTVTQNKLSVLNTSFDWSTVNGTAIAGSDFTGFTSQPLNITAGQISATFNVPILDDILTEGDESFSIQISNPVNSTLGSPTGTVTIIDNDLPIPIPVRDIGTKAVAIKSIVLGTKLIFINTSDNEGLELWVSDGTLSGTTILKDINPGTANGVTSNELISFGGKIYFAANDGTVGQELWVTDGTTSGTTLVKDIVAGSSSSNPQSFAVWNGKLYFGAFSSAAGDGELFVSDGTSVGTYRISDASPLASSYPINITPLGSLGVMYSADYADSADEEPFFSNGIATALLKDINVGWNSRPKYYTYFSTTNKVFFQAADNTTGYEPWITDGTTAGTTLLKDLYIGGSSSPDKFTEANSKMYFRALNTNATYDLWVSDSTTAGTISLTQSSVSTSVTELKPFGSELLFAMQLSASGNELWKSDGTLAGTVLVKDIYSGASSSNPTFLGIIGSNYLLSANDGVNGTELWTTDGTTAGTVLLKDINPSGSSQISDFTTDGTIGWFVANNGSDGLELWKTDGTSGGTVMVADINPSGNSSPANLAMAGSNLYFTGFDRTLDLAKLGYSDGSALGTALIVSGPSFRTIDGSIGSAVEFLGEAFFPADDGTLGTQLWRTNGTLAGTTMVKDLFPNGGCTAGITSITTFGSKIYFYGYGTGVFGELFTSDGTAGGTVLVKDIESGSGSSAISKITLFGSKFLFQASTTTTGYEPFISDGTTAGTQLLKDIYSGSNNSSPNFIGTVSSGNMLFYATSGTSDYELWTTDGTTAGTIKLETCAGTSCSGFSNTGAMVSGTYYYAGRSSASDTELWKSDGTAVGTSLVKDINAGSSASSSPSGLATVGNKIIFGATTAANGKELWQTDGTTAGTSIISDIYAGSTSGYNNYLGVANGYYFFIGYTAAAGLELWRTDGTSAGTILVKDLATGSGGSSIDAVTNRPITLGSKLVFQASSTTAQSVLWATDGTSAGTIPLLPNTILALTSFYAGPNGKMYFSAYSAAEGYEPWVTDGTLAGTMPLGNLYPGTSSSMPSGFSIVNGILYFKATDPQAGTELFRTPAP